MKIGGAYKSRNWEIPRFRASYFPSTENNNMPTVYRHDISRGNVSDFIQEVSVSNVRWENKYSD
jgi:hypothetical protein